MNRALYRTVRALKRAAETSARGGLVRDSRFRID
jgi:hypothetical protein